MDRFFLQTIEGEIASLDSIESHHCIKVLRKKAGDQIIGLDGQGTAYHATILEANPKTCRVQISRAATHPKGWPFDLEIIIAPTKNVNRFEWFVEKVTEIGIDAIRPVFCDHSERKKLKTDRIERIIRGAAKQSGKTYLPQLHDSVELEEYFGQINPEMTANRSRYIATCQNHSEKINLHQLAIPSEQKISLLIGPEGDFSPGEYAKAKDNGFQSLSLGNSRLRVETAGVAGCYGVHLLAQ